MAGAKPVTAGEGNCQFALPDASTVFVGIEADETFADWYQTYRAHRRVEPFRDLGRGLRVSPTASN